MSQTVSGENRMNDDRPISAVSLGVFTVFLGLVANKWVLEALISPDGNIESPTMQLLIATVQLLLIGIGMTLVLKRPRIGILSRKELHLAVASTLVSVLIIEMVLRIWLGHFSTPEQFGKYSLYLDVPSKSQQWIPHHYLNYYPTPNYSKGHTSHNSLGYRSREFILDKPENFYRIVTIGGSTTYTIAVEDNEQTFPYQLEKILREDYDYPNIEVINAGVGGYNSWESLVNFQFRVLDIDPDLIIVYHGTNDVHTRLVLPDAYKGDNSGRRQQWSLPDVPLAERSLLFRLILRRWGVTGQIGLGTLVNSPNFFGVGSGEWPIENDYAKALLNENQPIYFRRNLSNIATIAKSNGVDVIFATWAHSENFNDYASTEVYKQGFQENNQVVREVAEQHAAHLFDFAYVMPGEKEYWSDGRHVNEEGALLKARLFANFIDRSAIVHGPDSNE